MATANVKKFSDILADLTAHGAQLKSAAAKKADDNSKVVPEKDPNDKGNVGIPKDPDASATTQNLPESKTNADGTPVYTPPPAKVIDGPEKAAALSAKAASLLKTVQGLLKGAGSTASQISSEGSLPNDSKNDNKSKHPIAAPAPTPAHGIADPAVKESGKGTPTDKTEMSAPMPAGDSKGEMPTEVTNKDKTGKEASVLADVDLANIDHTFFSKLAQVCLQFEEGRHVMEACLKKAHGAEHAQNLIKTAMFMEHRMQELAQIEEAGTTAAEEFWKSASNEDRAGLLKLASTHEEALKSLATDLEREAYLEGAKIAADMADAGMAGEQPPPGVPGMGGEGDPAGAAAAGGPPGAGGAEGGEVSDEDIIQALQMLVQEGKLTEEDAEAILQQLMGGQGGGDPGAGGPPGGDPSGAGGPPPDADPSGGGGGMPPGATAGGAGAAGAGGPPPDEKEKGASAHLKTVGQAVDAVFASLA